MAYTRCESVGGVGHYADSCGRKNEIKERMVEMKSKDEVKETESVACAAKPLTKDRRICI